MEGNEEKNVGEEEITGDRHGSEGFVVPSSQIGETTPPCVSLNDAVLIACGTLHRSQILFPRN